MTGEETPAAYAGDRLDARETCALLEQGGILYFPKTPFTIAPADWTFLLRQEQTHSSHHKNISYKPAQHKISGAHSEDTPTLYRIMADYCHQTSQFIDTFLIPYAGNWSLDYGSFRPLEEKNRSMRLRARNDLLHVDSFPTRATDGKRILRVFTNISPDIQRVWQTSETFEQLLDRFKNQMKAPQKSLLSRRPAYDRWMMQFHNHLKENRRFQEKGLKNRWEFPPGSSWLVYTDFVSHSVLSGQYALEQTFLIDQHHQVLPEKAPINLLAETYR
jgi:hypothetical protein